MMTVAIIAYPVLSDDDGRWIERIRSAHDPQSAWLGAHFTLVFPTEAEPLPVVDHAAAVVRELRPISFVLRQVRAVRDFRGRGGHVFLVSNEGADEITLLHDRLYTGLLAPHLRTDVPFIPHLTVAAYQDFDECERLAELLNEQQNVVSGQLTAVDVVELQERAVRTLARVGMAG